MLRFSVALLLLSAACGGTQIPTHNGYKSATAKPWKKAKPLKFDEKMEAKAEGDVSYPAMRRAAWYSAQLPSSGELDLRVEITPTAEQTNDDFDLGVEVLDPANRPVYRSDLDEGSDQHELNKTKAVTGLAAGTYLIHLYLQGRLDTAEYVLHAAFKSGAAADGASTFPSQVAALPPLPQVPLTDDTPKNYRPPVAATPVVVHTVKHHGGAPPPPPPPPAAAVSARIIGVSVVSGGMKITVGRGTAQGAAAGKHGKVAGASFTLDNCTERACTAVVSGVTPDQIKGSGVVQLEP